MARPRSLKPAYCHDKTSGRAYVTLDNRKTYLGRFGTQESRDAYDRAIGEWIANGRTRPTPEAPGIELACAHVRVIDAAVGYERTRERRLRRGGRPVLRGRRHDPRYSQNRVAAIVPSGDRAGHPPRRSG